MKKLLSAVILHALLLPTVKAQEKFFDQPVQLKTCNISIEANQFIATTFIEMEFYNATDKEVEGYQNFRLSKGQVITAFQLDLNGKYRDGSIEEKWKAIRAYSSIVGKRVDPAILQMSYPDHYNIHIYPIPAHSSRKVTMTIDQLMTEDNSKLTYLLPLEFNSVTESFNLQINVDNNGTLPECNEGFLKSQSFVVRNNAASLQLELKDIKLDKPISFSIFLKEHNPQICITKENDTGKFIMRFSPTIVKQYLVQPKTISVFWDVSTSAESRNLRKEINFLEQYISLNKITSTTITLFNHKMKETVVMDSRTKDFNVLRNYLLGYPYGGATCLGNLNFSEVKADAILLFSDGFNSYGRSVPPAATVQLSCIVSSPSYDAQKLQSIMGTTGGALINLFSTKIDSAVKLISKAKNFLVKYDSKEHSVKLNEKFPVSLTNNILLSGTFKEEDHLQLIYGNSVSINRVEDVYLSVLNTCRKEVYDKVRMLKSYDSIMTVGRWQDMVVFGLNERVVTQQTSFLVLERLEDYIKYNIAPPKELEEACAERNYVYKSEHKIRALKTFTDRNALQETVNTFNQYIKWWAGKDDPINLDKIVNQATIQPGTDETGDEKNSIASEKSFALPVGENKSSTIKEVIVTSAFQTRRTARSTSSSTQVIYGDQLNTVFGNDLNSALAGKVSGIQIRSQSSTFGSTSSIRLRGESAFSGRGPIYVLDGMIMTDVSAINVHDIDYVTVLQAPSASALFGSEGSAGAIVISTKKARRPYYSYYPKWTDYTLENEEDESYITEIRNCEIADIMDVYTELENANKGHAIFYFDMAECFFERQLKDKALEILLEGVETCKDSPAALKGAAFIFESWKEFNEAIKIYKDILENSPHDMITKRDLALAYYQNGQYQLAVDTYYQVISSHDETDYNKNEGIQVTAMNEMNAVISMFGSCLNLGSMNLNLVKLLPVDIRITAESNYSYLNNFRITDPLGKEFNYQHQYAIKSWNYNREYRGYYTAINDHSIKNAIHGSYKIKIDSYNNYNGYIPIYIRLVVFKNFQKKDQTLEVKHIALNGQYGAVEVASIKW